jgi:hypothetical protein
MNAFDQALENGFLDIEAALERGGFLRFGDLSVDLRNLMFRKGAAFIFDPKNRLGAEGLDRLAKGVRDVQVEFTMRFDADQPWDAECQRLADLSREVAVSFKAVQGRKGKGWRVVPNEALAGLIA